MRTHLCGYWCPGAEAPGHQYPQWWLNIDFIWPVSYQNITFIMNSITKHIYFLENEIKSNTALQWHHNEHDGISNHQQLDCLLIICSGADQRKHQNSTSLAFVRGIRWWPVDSPHKGPVTQKMFPCDDIIMNCLKVADNPKALDLWDSVILASFVWIILNPGTVV